MTRAEAAGCLYPECPHAGKRFVRGLCINHYQASLRLVLLGRTTWKRLEEQGKALEAKPPARRNPGSRKFVDWALEGGSARKKEKREQ